MLVYTKTKEVPKVNKGYQAVLIGTLPWLLLSGWQHVWAVYPEAPEKLPADDSFDDKVDTFIKELPKL